MTVRIDPITVEVIRNRLISNATEMTETIKRAAYSPIIYEVLDLSNAIHDRQGNLVVQAPGIPLFLGAMPAVVNSVLDRFGIENIYPGDVIISNDPHSAGGTHVNDINMVVPIFWENELVLFANSKAHWIDIGGKDPGSWSPDAENIYQEGIILPPIKLYERGQLNETALEIIMANVRVPDYSRGDLRAQLAACRVAEKRTHEVFKRYGSETVTAAIKEIMDHGERLIRAEIEGIPDGVYRVEDYVDSDGITDKPIKVVTTVTVQGSELSVDFTGSDPQTQGAGGNCAWAGTVSAVRLAIKCLTDPDLPGNQGCYRPIKVHAPKGTCVNPLSPAAVTVGLGDVSHVIIESIFRALASALPEKTIAGMYGTVSALVISGQDPRQDNRPYIHFMPYSGGWGARASKDGISGLMTIVNGDCLNVPVEVVETKYPLRVERYEMLPDSGGAGKYRGGLGLAVEYRLLDSDANISVGLSRYKIKPYGLFGGKEGIPSVTRVTYPDGTSEELFKIGGKSVPKGSLISHSCGGGGGYGSPAERDPELIKRDIQNGYITEEAARCEYGFERSLMANGGA
jgi:N-methylhydantoinase B